MNDWGKELDQFKQSIDKIVQNTKFINSNNVVDEITFVSQEEKVQNIPHQGYKIDYKKLRELNPIFDNEIIQDY